MSCNYAEGLSPYHDKGQLGLEEKFDSKAAVAGKVTLLTQWINEAKHVVIHTGAGISTSAGIPDFRQNHQKVEELNQSICCVFVIRGPRGVWTLQEKGEKPDLSKDFNEATPTITHMAITKLVEKGKVQYVVSQNIDGLHLRSNLPRKFLSELHGNMFTEQCSSCNRQFIRNIAVPTVGQKSLNKPCPTLKANGRPCRGKLHDTILDWEHNLPENDLGMADYHSCLADLSICLGTTLQIVPSGNLPLYTRKLGGKLVIINLQPTKHNKKADLIIHAYVDEVMTMLMKNLGIKIPKYSVKNDPTRQLSLSSEKFIEWTISDNAVKKMRKIYEEKCGTKEARKRLEILDDDTPLSITKTYKRRGKDEDDSDLEVLDVIVKKKSKGKRDSKKGNQSTPVYNTTITIKKVTTPPPKKAKYEPAEKITIKKNVTPTRTKYEIVTKPKKPSCEIVYCTDGDLCNDLDMICESDDDEMTNNFTYNFKRYLYADSKKGDDKSDVKREIKSEIKEENDVKEEVKEEIKGEIKETEKPDEKNVEKNNELAAQSADPIDNAVETVNDLEETEKTSKIEKTVGDTNYLQQGLEGKESENAKLAPVTDTQLQHMPAEAEPSPQEQMEPAKSETEDSTGKDEDKSQISQITESEVSNAADSNLETLVDETTAEQFDSSLSITNCNENSGSNENYEFYSNEFSSVNNPLDYEDNNYYQNF